MKKRIIIILFILLLTIPFVWLASLVRCEILTVQHGNKFEHGYKQTNMLGDDIDSFRVLNYSNTYARVCYIEKEDQQEDFINIISFVKKDGEWTFEEWEDSFWSTDAQPLKMYPYIFVSLRGIFITIIFGILWLIPIIILLRILIRYKKQYKKIKML